MHGQYIKSLTMIKGIWNNALSLSLAFVIILMIIGYSPRSYDPVLFTTAILDFGNTAAGSASDLTVTITGAADGDPITLGVPNSSTVANGNFTAWVSAANTVTVRYINPNLITALDPGSGTFKIIVHKK